MFIYNRSLDSLSVSLSALPPQHQNLAPPPLEAANNKDSVLLSRDTQSEPQQLSTSATLSTETALSTNLLNQENQTVDNTSSQAQNRTQGKSQDQTQIHAELEPLPAEEREPQCRSRPSSYSVAASTNCAFSSEAAPALLFQEDFYTAWPLGATLGAASPSTTQIGSSPNNTSQTEISQTDSSQVGNPQTGILQTEQTEQSEPVAEPLGTAYYQPEAIHNTTESTNIDNTKNTVSSITVESSSSTRSKAEAKKAPADEPPTQAEEQALREEKEQQEKQRLEVIYDRIKAEKLLHEAKRQAIWADLQTELRRIWREVMLRRKKSEDDYQKSWQKIFLNAG